MLCKLSYGQFLHDAKNLYQDMFEDTNFTDVTLVCGESKTFKAHKVILSSCSTLFKNILVNNPHPNPMVYFYDIKEEQMETILIKFIYTGEASVPQEDLDALLNVANKLNIHGLAEETSSKESDENKPSASADLKKNMFDKVTNTAIEDYSRNESPIEMNQETKSNYNAEEADEKDQVEVIPVEEPIKSEFTSIDTDDQDEPSLNIEENLSEEGDLSVKVKEMVRKFLCKFCQHKSTTSSNLNTHQKSQHGYVREKKMRIEGKYPCDECDYKATQSGNLGSHKKMKHQGIKFPCNFCSHESGSTSNLMSHIKRRHTDK